MLLMVLRIVLLSYLGLMLYLYFFQGRMIYFPSREFVADPGDADLAWRDVELTAADGVRLHGWWVPAAKARVTVLLFHGNAGNISHRVDLLLLFNELNASTLIVDYRGYGQSQGKPSERGTYRDAAVAWEWLTKTQGIPPGRIVVHGRSLGGGVASWLAAREDEPAPGGLVLDSTFTSITDMGARIYPYLPVRLLSRYRYDTRARADRLTMPLLVMHSRDDEMIPFSLGEELYRALPEPKEFVSLGRGHEDNYLEPGYRQALDRLYARVATSLESPPASR